MFDLTAESRVFQNSGKLLAKNDNVITEKINGRAKYQLFCSKYRLVKVILVNLYVNCVRSLLLIKKII